MEGLWYVKGRPALLQVLGRSGLQQRRGVSQVPFVE